MLRPIWNVLMNSYCIYKIDIPPRGHHAASKVLLSNNRYQSNKRLIPCLHRKKEVIFAGSKPSLTILKALYPCDTSASQGQLRTGTVVPLPLPRSMETHRILSRLNCINAHLKLSKNRGKGRVIGDPINSSNPTTNSGTSFKRR